MTGLTRLLAGAILGTFAVTCVIGCGRGFVAAQTVQQRVTLKLGNAKEITAPQGSATAGSKWIQMTVTCSNGGTRSIWFEGHSKKTPFYEIQTRPDNSAKWSDYGIAFDGIPNHYRIRPDSKHSFTIALPERYRGSEIRVLLDYYTDRSAKDRRTATSTPKPLVVPDDEEEKGTCCGGRKGDMRMSPFFFLVMFMLRRSPKSIAATASRFSAEALTLGVICTIRSEERLSGRGRTQGWYPSQEVGVPPVASAGPSSTSASLAVIGVDARYGDAAQL